MKRKERQRKFHDALVDMLYAPPPSPPPQNQFDEQTLNLAREIANSDHHPINTDELKGEEERSFSASSEDEDESGSQKLTRAQRKRLRKKKLKEAASHRRQIIGPQLPTAGDDLTDGEGSGPEGVRRNAAEGPESGNDNNHRGETPSTIKVKHRRMSKKTAKDNTKTRDARHEAANPGDQN